jgi:threonine/homoserine/homoserine lactone efflux protein
MELFVLFFNSLIVGFSGALMPGPLLAVGIAETPRHGWQTGPIISIGHAIAEIAVVALLSIGFAWLAESRTVAGVIGVVGGIALILMGAAMGYDVVRKRIDYSGAAATRQSGKKLAGKGITATLSNPYWFVWWGTTGLAFIVKSLEFGFVGPVVFYFGHIMSDFLWYSLVSVLLWRGKSFLAASGLRVLILCCAVFLVYLGVTFIVDGVSV